MSNPTDICSGYTLTYVNIVNNNIKNFGTQRFTYSEKITEEKARKIPQLGVDYVIYASGPLKGVYRPIELLGQAAVSETWGKLLRQIIPLTDLATGITINIYWEADEGGYHTDWVPVGTEDVDKIKSILNPGGGDVAWDNPNAWTRLGAWNAREGFIIIDGRRIAVGFHLRPHDVNIVTSNPLPYGGHMCMFYGSGGQGDPDTMIAGNDAARRAASFAG